jgi:tetratricopeptide (TPR) repeat protein
MAKEFLEASLKRKPTDGRNRAEYAWYIGSSGETNEAIEQFNMAINSDPTYAYLHMLYAMWCVNQVKTKIDITNTVQFVEKYRNEQRKDETLKSYDNRSINGVSIATFLRTGQMEWNKALSLGARRYQDEYESLADFHLMRFELDKAISNYKRADNKLMLTRCYIIKGNYNKAVNILGLIIKKEEGKLSGVRLAKIKKLLLVVIDHDPNNYRSFYCLGKIHTRLGKTEKAIGNFKTTVNLKPKHIDAHLSLAELYNQTGKIDLAIEEYETILSLSPNHKEATRLLSEAIRLKYKNAEFLKTSTP